MNLHSIVSNVINAINPNQPVTVWASTGYTTNADGSRVPSYTLPMTAIGQVQELSTRDLRQLDGLNIQGSSRAIYITGEIDAIIRLNQQGGDLVRLQDGTVYLTTSVLEQWPNWCKVSVTLQNQTSPGCP